MANGALGASPALLIENVDGAEGGARRLQAGLDRCGISDVEAIKDQRAPFGQRRRDRRERLAAPAREADARAGVGEPARNRGADAPAGAGHQRVTVGEIARHHRLT